MQIKNNKFMNFHKLRKYCKYYFIDHSYLCFAG